MKKPNFFCSTEVMNHLTEIDYELDEETIDLTVDITDIPYFCIFTRADKIMTVTLMQTTPLAEQEQESLGQMMRICSSILICMTRRGTMSGRYARSMPARSQASNLGKS